MTALRHVERAELPSGTVVEISRPAPDPQATAVIPYAPHGETWIAPREAATHAGRGTQFDPIRVAGPDQFDAVFRNVIEPWRFRLVCGEFSTRGRWAFPTRRYCLLRPGQELLGDGPMRTRIALDEPVTDVDGNSRIDVGVIWAGAAYSNGDFVRVEGVAIDGNATRHNGLLVTTGLRVWGSRAVVRNVRVTGLSGSKVLGHEAFGISTINHLVSVPTASPFDGGTIVEDCEVVNKLPGEQYLSAFSIGYRPMGRPIAPSIVQRCRAIGCGADHAAWTAVHATTFRDCWSSGFLYGLYNDTDSVDRVALLDSTIEATYSGIQIVATKPGDTKRDIRVSGCLFKLSPVTQGGSLILMTLWDKVQGNDVPIATVRVADNIIEHAGKFTIASLLGNGIANVRIHGNQVFGPGPVQLNLHGRSPGSWLRASDNTSSSGEAIIL